jgi:hypothetical protein
MAIQSDSWIEQILKDSSVVDYEEPFESELCELLVDACIKNKTLSEKGIGLLFASSFDLLIAAQYYSTLPHKGWFYCPTGIPRLFFHYTNCCPRDVLSNQFYFNPSAKPSSGRIGAATSRLLLVFYKTIFKKLGLKEEILRGTEPVDAVIVNRHERKVLFAEIKASPLLTIPLSVKSQRLTEEVTNKIVHSGHASVDNTVLFETDLEIFVPKKERDFWIERYYPIGKKRNAGDYGWGYRGFVGLLKNNPDFFREYFAFWNECLKSYYPKSHESVFWLTNACGAPNNLPSGWATRREGEGYETISDTKTSVGMDRTDDIKKGVYQVLKLGSIGKPIASKWDYKVGLVSNIHAARHFDEYLGSLKDIIWTLDSSGKAKKISDLPSEQAVYNLFDGIIALTVTISRDDWINSIFSYGDLNCE